MALFFFPISSIMLLIRGNEIAFENREYNSVEDFHKGQRIWVICGLVINILFWGSLIQTYNSLVRAVRTGSSHSMSQPLPGSQAAELADIQTEMARLKKDQQEGMGITETKGKDANGAYIATTQIMPTDPAATYNLYKAIVAELSGSEVGSTSTSADFVIPSKNGTTTIHLEQTADNKTMVVTKEYGKK
ncbi:MAG: hypothetical protein ACYC0V_13590 [Armatimonadota bacterium]